MTLDPAQRERWIDDVRRRHADAMSHVMILSDRVVFTIHRDAGDQVIDVPDVGLAVTVRLTGKSAVVIKELPRSASLDLRRNPGRRVNFSPREYHDIAVLGAHQVEVAAGCRIRSLSIASRPNQITGTNLQVHGTIDRLRGSPRWLVVDSGGNCVGHGLVAPRHLSGKGEVENVSLFRLNNQALDSALGLRRLSPWWPRRKSGRPDWDEAVILARTMALGHWDPASRPAARRDFWTTVDQYLREKGASGEDRTTAHMLAMEMRRLAAPRWSVERLLLGLSRGFGHGNRLGQPVAVWLASAAVGGFLLWAIPLNLPVGALPGVIFDVAVSPISFVRSGGDRSLLQDGLSARDWPWRALAFLARTIGTVSLVFAAVAVRRLTRGATSAT